MSRPARYAEVFPADGSAAGPALLAGSQGETYASAHDFSVVVYLGLPPRQTGPQATDTAAVQRLVEGRAGDAYDGQAVDLPGLRLGLDAQGYLRADSDGPGPGGEMPVRNVRLVALRPALLADGTSDEWRHEALITLSVLG